MAAEFEKDVETIKDKRADVVLERFEILWTDFVKRNTKLKDNKKLDEEYLEQLRQEVVDVITLKTSSKPDSTELFDKRVFDLSQRSIHPDLIPKNPNWRKVRREIQALGGRQFNEHYENRRIGVIKTTIDYRDRKFTGRQME